MSDLLDLYLSIVRWFLDTVLTVLGHMGLGGGYLHDLVSWLAAEAELYLASVLAAVVLLLWVVPMVVLASWIDRRVRARAQGRAGPRHVGPYGLLQCLADWLKLVLRRREGMPSAVPAGVSGSMVLAALALTPWGPWARLADPEWGLLAVTTLLALSPLPMALVAPRGRRHGELAETAGSGVVLMLAVGSMMLVAGSARTGELVDLQGRSAWGFVLSPLGFLLLLVVMTWDSDRFARLRRAGTAAETWPGGHRALGMYAVASRYMALAILGTVLFLGGWSGPLQDGVWWTLLKAHLLLAFTSMVAGALPAGRPETRARNVRTIWLPLAAANLVMVAAVLEVMA